MDKEYSMKTEKKKVNYTMYLSWMKKITKGVLFSGHDLNHFVWSIIYFWLIKLILT